MNESDKVKASAKIIIDCFESLGFAPQFFINPDHVLEWLESKEVELRKRGVEKPPVNKLIHEAFRTLTHAVHANAVEHGWFDTEMPNKEMEFLVGMAGVMKECGEALEVVSAKEWDVMDDKCPQHTKLSIELADIVLRLLTLCGRHDLNIGAAITAKHEFNRSRPYRHGGKAF